jgi:hypothetical protein
METDDQYLNRVTEKLSWTINGPLKEAGMFDESVEGGIRDPPLPRNFWNEMNQPMPSRSKMVRLEDPLSGDIRTYQSTIPFTPLSILQAFEKMANDYKAAEGEDALDVDRIYFEGFGFYADDQGEFISLQLGS